MPQQDFSAWTSRERPRREPLEGRFVRLEPLDAARHGDGLFEASTTADANERFRWLGEDPPESRGAFQPWLEKAEASADPVYFTVIDKASGKIAGRQTFMRIDAPNGVVEVGSILWNGLVARRPAATEALYLFARHAFDDLGYRRFEWKCNNRNGPSKRAALRFGFVFEGLFRQHMIVKGENRDTAWFSMLDRDWPELRSAFETWLDPANFDSEGRQRVALSSLTARSIGKGSLSLKRAGADAIRLVESIQRDAYSRTRQATGAEPLPLTWNYDDILAECEVWVCEDPAGATGALILRRREGDLYLESIATAARATGSGIGSAMMAAAFDRARTLSLPVIRLMTNAKNPAADWYKRLGFRIEKEETGVDRTVLHMAASVD